MADDVTKVVSLEVKRAEPNPVVIEMLREWLAMAKAGHLRRVVLAGEIQVGDDDEVCRYGVAGMDEMTAAGLLEQHAHNLRHDLAHETYDTRSEPVTDDDE